MVLQYDIVALGLQLLDTLLQLLFESSSFPYFEQYFPTKSVESAAVSFPFQSLAPSAKNPTSRH